MPVCLPTAPVLPLAKSIGIALGALALLAILGVAAACLLVAFWKDFADLARKRAKLKGPPGELA